MKLAYAFCGSFCTHARALAELEKLVLHNDVTAAFSEITAATDTRFGSARALADRVGELTGKKIIRSIKDAEDTVTRGGFDAVIVSPCTGNTLAKIASGITDSTVTMCVKACLRNRKPVVIALATNDGLGANLVNIALTLEKKNVYFVPFGQDSPEGKPTSLICDFTRLGETLTAACEGRQLQPILV